MLVLTRRAIAGDHSAIRIGDDIEITVTEIRGDQMRIGINAPRSTNVHRAEVNLQNKQENRDAPSH